MDASMQNRCTVYSYCLWFISCHNWVRFNADFVICPVVPRELSAPATDQPDDSGLPDWAIAVIVIGLGSFAFVLIFGITVVSFFRLYFDFKQLILKQAKSSTNRMSTTSINTTYNI